MMPMGHVAMNTPHDEANGHLIWSRSEPAAENLRRHGRVKCHDVGCTLGEVIDLSASGVRVRAKGRVSVRSGDAFVMTIQTLDGPMLAPVRVAWVRRTGFRTHEIGITFSQTGPALTSALSNLARASANNEVISPWFKERGAA